MPVQREGFINRPHGRVWWTSMGGSEEPALLTLHGGPGGACNYLSNLDAHATSSRAVVRYDQLGCGKSDSPDDESLWTVDFFAEEVDAVRHALGLNEIVLYGHSWGGALALEYLLTRDPQGVRGLILDSTLASTDSFERGVWDLVLNLPDDVRAPIVANVQGEQDDRSFTQRARADWKLLRQIDSSFSPRRTLLGTQALAHELRAEPMSVALATAIFAQRHMCTLNPMPVEVLESGNEMYKSQAYSTIWGPSDYKVLGNLAGWDRTDRIHEIDIPTLITVGRYGEAVPACSEQMHAEIASSQLTIFEDSAHFPSLEEHEKFESTLSAFLASC